MGLLRNACLVVGRGLGDYTGLSAQATQKVTSWPKASKNYVCAAPTRGAIAPYAARSRDLRRITGPKLLKLALTDDERATQQADSSGPGKELNWLPTQAGAFRPIMCTYHA
jgi:hypothetical protein